MKKFIKKELNLLKDRKKELSINLKEVRKDLNKKKIIDINDFMKQNADNLTEKYSNIKDCLNPTFKFIFIKILGPIFVTFYLVGIFEIIGLMNAIYKEISDSFNLIIFDEQKETNFYQNYINENLNTPSLDLFFLSSFLSDSLINLLTFPGTVCITLLLNILIIYFGLDYFSFRQGENLNIKYSFQENIILILIYLGLYILIGIIALVPQKILQNAFLSYDIDNGEDIGNAPLKGYIFCYIFSIVLSSIIKILLDRIYVFDKIRLIIDNKNDDSFFSYIVIIIIIYICSTISSMVLYFPFLLIFEGNEKFSITIQSYKICGYMIFKQDISEGFCYNCKINCSISADNCGYCLGCHYCNCFEKCCSCCCEEYPKASDDSQTLCIIYKIKGIIPWFFSLIAGPFMFLIILFMYLYEILNIGFKPLMSEYLNDKSHEKDITIMNIIYFSSFIFLYLMNYLIGFIDKKCKKKNGKNMIIGYEEEGVYYFIFITCILSVLFSAFSYYDVMNNFIYYLINFSVSISEYVNILVLYFTKKDDIGSLNIIGKAFAISFYKIVYKIVPFIFKIIKISNKGLVLMQFIVAIIVFSLQSLVILVDIICPKPFGE